jgi:predicted nucleic acid-binding protein
VTTPTGVSARATRYLLDTSVWARLASRAVAEQVAALQSRGQVVVATPVALELGCSARTPAEWDDVQGALATFPVLEPTGATRRAALGLQRALWAAGKVRAAGAFDTLVAALAVEHRAVVVHYDRDYEHLASVEPRLAHAWVAPPGSLDRGDL